MRKYLFGTGLIGAATSGLSMLKAIREGEPFTWRTALAWVSWGVTLALAIGAAVDIRRAGRGHLAPLDSPVSGHEKKYLKQRLDD